MTKKKDTENQEFANTTATVDFAELNDIVLQDLRKALMANENFRPRKYEIDQIRTYLANPEQNERQLREVSQYLLSTSSQYFRLIKYFSEMLTLDNMLVPVNVRKEEFTGKNFENAFLKANTYIENYNIKHEFKKILNVCMLEDVFYGYEWQSGDSIMIQRLPANFCKVTSIEDGVFNFSFNFSFFDNQNRNIENYPPEFKSLYNTYKKDTTLKWQELDGSKSVCFKFREDINFPVPPFSGAFEEILDMEDVKDLAKTKAKISNFKLIVQKIPMKKDAKNEKDFIISLPSVKMFHKNIKNALPDGVALVSTPMDLDSVSFEPKNDSVANSTDFVTDQTFNSIGVSAGLFNSTNDNTISLNRGINVDESFMFGFLRQIERFFRKRLKANSSKKFQFKLIFPDLTVYNRSEMLDLYMKTAQYGFPKMLVSCAMGLSVSDLVNLSNFENEYLNMTIDILKPPPSANIGNAMDKGGRPQKDGNKLSPEGEKTKAKGSNDNK